MKDSEIRESVHSWNTTYQLLIHLVVVRVHYIFTPPTNRHFTEFTISNIY